MNLLSLGIASIVDANTGNGINHQYVNQFGSNKTYYAKLGRDNALLDLIGKIKASVKQYIDESKALAQERRDTREILQMSDHMLRDIGLSQNDIYDIRSGLISLDTLNARRTRYYNNEDARLIHLKLSSKHANIGVKEPECANRETAEFRKCA